MKNRPLKHKADNAFKFKSFNERMSEIDIRRSALYHVDYEYFTYNDTQSIFHQTIQKWSVLNLTEEYQNFHQKVRDVVTLPQLLHRKEFVLDHLYKCLDEATNLSLQPLLEILVVLAKDLREEFYPHFIKFFEQLTSLLKTRDPDQLEWTFVSLAFLFKLLKGFLRKDISLLFNEILKLLDDKQPLHITNFATECFSFIVRDIKNKKNLISLVIASVKENENLVMGCGRLFFEIIRGVNQQFHNCAEEFLASLFEFLNDTHNNEDGKYLFQVLTQMVTDMLQIISFQNIEPFWNIANSCLEKFLNCNIINENAINYIVHTIGIVIEFRQGKYITNSSMIIQKLIKIMDTVKSEETMLSVMQIASLMIMSSQKVELSQLDASRVSKKLVSISVEYPKVFMKYIHNVIEYSQFEVLMYPDFIKFFEKTFDSDSMELLTEIVMKKSPLCKNGVNLNDWKQFNITLKQESSEKKFLQILKMPTNEVLENSKQFIQAVILFPHLINLQDNLDALSSIEKCMKDLCDKLDKPTGADSSENLLLKLLLISILVETLMHTDADYNNFVTVIHKILPFCQKQECLGVLNTLDLCLSYLHKNKKCTLDKKLFDKIHSAVKHNLHSHHHNARRLTTHILTLFNHLDMMKTADDTMTLFDVLYNIEIIEPTIKSYRDQIMLIQKLGYETKFFQSVKEKDIQMDALRYISALYFVNFSLLWEPANDVIKSYCEKMTTADFWAIYKNQIEFSHRMETKEQQKIVQQSISPIIDKYQDSLWEMDDKVDFINYRWLLLKYLSNYSKVFEAKNRDIVEIFLQFIQTEYRYKNSSEHNDEDNESDSKSPKATQKFLIAYLKIFSNMSNLKAVYRTSELYNLFLDLLTHRNYEVQNLALDCIMLYKEPHLAPYKDILYKIVNDKTMKDCLMSFFKLNEHNMQHECEIQIEHRPLFVPFLFKILYTKLTMKMTTPELKMTILRFIGRFDECELFIFTNMVFGYFEKHLKENPLKTFKFIIDEKNEFDFDLQLPSNKLQGIMQMLESVKTEIAGLKSEIFTKYLLQITLCIDSILHRINTSNYKPLKSKGLLNIIDFFKHFDKYKWCEEEIETIFEIHIWPTIEKLPNDCIHQPTPLLKLLHVWSQNPKYYILFSKFKEDQQHLTPLPYVVQLLNGKHTSMDVCNTILQMIEKMLMFQNEARFDQIPIKNYLKVDLTLLKEKNLNFGSGLLLPYLPDILQFYRFEMKSKKIIGKQNLSILSRITDIVSEPETCKILLNVVLPITTKRIESSSVDGDIVQEMLATILCLIRQIVEPQIYIRKLAPLFQRITDLKARKILIDILEAVAIKVGDDKYKQLFEIIRDMNAMHRKWLEQPDYEKRLDAFKTVEILTDTNEICMDLGVLFVHQCYFYLKTDKDLAIRDNSRHQMRKVCIAIIRSTREIHDDHNYFIEKIVLPAILKGLKDKNLEAKNESITLLGELSRDCSDDHRVFKDLSHFTCSRNREIDFFDNMTHMQIHKHRKAMNRFVKVAENLTEQLSSQSMMNFIYPIVSYYLCNEEFKKKAKMTESAINCIGIICRNLSWHNYRFILKNYLDKLKRNAEYQKQIIKLIGLILDAFHFDLSNSDVNDAIKNDIEKIDQKIIDTVEIRKSDEIISGENSVLVDTKSPLNKEMANKITYDISKVIIPELFNTINFKASADAIKSLEKKERFAREKEEMAKIPIAIAIVKLLQKLPKDVLEQKLPKLILKIANFLKSQMKQVRGLARDTLKSMLESLGVEYFNIILENLQAVLRKGFQVHVLTVTVHTLLDAVKDQIKPGNIEPILQTILNICIDDIFGRLSEEKEVHAVTRKTPEAKPSKKSFLTLNILAKNIGEKFLVDLLLPFNQILAKTHSRKSVLKVQEAFNKIAEGFTTNVNLSIESLLIFTFGIASDIIPELIEGSSKAAVKSAAIGKSKISHSDTYLIQSEPKRRGHQLESSTTSKTNTHVLLELGLEILHSLIKRNQLKISNYQTYLDPLIPILRDGLSSKHMKVVILSLRCLTSIWSAKLHMETIIRNLECIVEEVFKILHKYATAGIMRMDDNFHLVKSAFKALVTLLRYTTYFKFSGEQLKVLLLYVEQDLYNSDKQTMAFILLRAIIARKLEATEINDIMMKVAEISINAEIPRVREEARIVFLEYLIEYPLGKKLDSHLNFIVNQLEYDVLSGRTSAVETLVNFFTKFPEEILNKKAGFFFLSLGVRLVNEESTELRQKIAESIELLLRRIDKNVQNELFELILVMMIDNKLSHKEMSAQLCIRFVNIEKKHFNVRSEKAIPCLIDALTNSDSNTAGGQFVKLKDNNNESNEEDVIRANDHFLFQTLVAIGKIFQYCPTVLTEKQLNSYIGELGYTLQSFLAHDHLWVRQEALNLIGTLLKTTDIEMIHKIIRGECITELPREYLYSNPLDDLKSLTMDMCSQLLPGESNEEIVSKTIQNLLFIANIIKVIPLKYGDKCDNEEDENTKNIINLHWLLRRIRYIIHGEVTKAPTTFIFRKYGFNWIEALLTLIDDDKIVNNLAASLLSPLIREMNDEDHVKTSIKQKASHLCSLIKSKIGDKEFDRLRLQLKDKLMKKRMGRKKHYALLKVNNPVDAAKKKISIQQKKKEYKKRKNDSKTSNTGRGPPKPKRKRMEDLFS